MKRIYNYMAMIHAALIFALPANAGEQELTINGEGDPTAVGTFVTKFEGEIHTLDITIEDDNVELNVTTEDPTNGLWMIDSARRNGATFRLADASAKQNHASKFIFTQKTDGGSGGSGVGGGNNKNYEAIAQQIQIFASFPGNPADEVPRPTTPGEEYSGIIVRDNPEYPVRIRLVYNREQTDDFDPSLIWVDISDGLQIIGRPSGENNASAIAASLMPGSEVNFDVVHDSDSINALTALQSITLYLIDQYGIIHQDEVKLHLPYVQNVGFSGESEHFLYSDDYTVQYTSPQWIDNNGDGLATDFANGEHDYAIAYTRKTAAKIQAGLKMGKITGTSVVMIRVKGKDGVNFPPTEASYRADGLYILDETLSGNESPSGGEALWPDSVKFYDRSNPEKAFTLDWEAKIATGAWLPIGKTSHQVYLTLNNPTTDLKMESLFYISSKAADGSIEKYSATDKIWEVFTTPDRMVTRADGQSLHYYKSFRIQNTATFPLLKNRDGQCTAWVRFHADLMKAQGLENEYSLVQVKAKKAGEGFLVKNWSDDGTGLGIEYGYRFANVYNIDDERGFLKDDHYEWLYSDSDDDSGERGQGQLNPASLFCTHVVLANRGKYYDPSYGKIYNDLEGIDDVIYGFFKDRVLGDADGDIYNSFQIRVNPAGLDIEVDLIENY